MKRRLVIWLALCSAFLLTPVQAQEKFTERTLKLSPGAKSPPATLDAMKWLRGHWTARAFGGVAEELWSDANGGAMMGVYRLTRGGKPVFYELLTIVEENGSLMLRLRHFNPDLKGWEEKNQTVEFPLVALRDGAIHFEGMSFRPDGKNAFTVYLVTEQADGASDEHAFAYSRVP